MEITQLGLSLPGHEVSTHMESQHPAGVEDLHQLQVLQYPVPVGSLHLSPEGEGHDLLVSSSLLTSNTAKVSAWIVRTLMIPEIWRIHIANYSKRRQNSYTFLPEALSREQKSSRWRLWKLTKYAPFIRMRITVTELIHIKIFFEPIEVFLFKFFNIIYLLYNVLVDSWHMFWRCYTSSRQAISPLINIQHSIATSVRAGQLYVITRT